MKKILSLVVAVMLVAVGAFAGQDVVVQWEAPIYGTSTNLTVTFTFTRGSVGVLDNVWLSPAPAYTNTVKYTLIQNSGAMTNTINVDGTTISNAVTPARWTTAYLMALNDQLVINFANQRPDKTNAYAIWMRDVTK